jgi:uncharacterized tellurite resistance protein B-like protein
MLRQFLRKLTQPEQQQIDDSVSVEIATAVLMVEVAHADHDFSDADSEVVMRELERSFGIDASASRSVLTDAIALHERHVSFHDIVRLLNREVVPESRVTLLKALWRVALSDQVVHRYEEGQIRKIADWLYIPHRDFIRSKLDVQEERA